MTKQIPLFILPLLCTLLLLAGCERKAFRIRSIDDLKDKRIGVLQGSVHDLYATKTFPKATILQFKSPSDIIVAVRSGKVEAGIYTSDELTELIGQQPDVGLFGPALFSSDVAMGFHRDNKSLCRDFNAFLKEIDQNGIYDDMVERWMKKRETAMPDIATPQEAQPLLIGILSDNGLPFTAVKDNRLIGFNIELLERFAASIGRKPSWLDMQFGSMIPALASKKIDMIGTVMWITNERKKQITFSDPYYVQGAYFFTLKKNIAPGAEQPQQE